MARLVVNGGFMGHSLAIGSEDDLSSSPAEPDFQHCLERKRRENGKFV